MSGARDADGAQQGPPGADGWPPAAPAPVAGAPGSPDGGPQQGGTTVTDTRPPHHQARPQTHGAGLPGGAPATPAQPYAAQAGRSQTQPQAGQDAAGVRRPRPAARPGPRTRKARLRVAKADPWSVMKVSFLLSIALGVCTVVAVAMLWLVLDAIGVFDTVGSTISEATTSDQGGGGFDLVSFLSLGRVLTITTVIAVIDVVLATALATLGSFIYNMSAGLVGGVELTLAEDE